ncbi:2-alkenal reductase (NADP(+)-dependent) isoform X1 [Ricinus communis]|uniref:Alcohol dehydrogenase, putative n=2 Tax=Ricinus communis TaxID=3988 RepID=B9SER7_RICCO|nr:2-alkenal reductase (NADP(+)-dependent) isoform X1 [Ricinus communis]EEF37926.1 alcohol dehydrogenase, putative [Ricinus communis]
MEVTNRYVVTKAYIDGAPKESEFELKSEAISLLLEPGSNDVIVKNLYVSIDPYQLNRMKSRSSSQTHSSFATAINPGDVIDAYGIAKVLASGNPEFQKDDLVIGLITWGEYSVIKPGAMLRKFDPMRFPMSHHVGILGFSGLTAYAGLFEVCKPKKGEKVFVSAASGSVGNLVGQYAKLFGCYVVGCAGSKEKIAMLKEKLGFDDAFNYKEETDLKATLKRYFPDGIDIYFDNVGAEMQEAAIANMKIFGRVAVCGVISEYTDSGRKAAPEMIDVVYRRIKIQGFLAADFMNVYADFISTTCDYLRAGKMHVLEDISTGVESIPTSLIGLFRGHNIGKKMVQLAAE